MKDCFKTWILAITPSRMAWMTGVCTVAAADEEELVLTNIGQIRALSPAQLAPDRQFELTERI